MYDEEVLNVLDSHKVIIMPDTNTIKLMQCSEIFNNSAHVQCVDTLGNDLIVTGKSSQNIVEAVEHKDPNYCCFAVQSHPEILEESFFEPLFKAFASAVLYQELK